MRREHMFKEGAQTPHGPRFEHAMFLKAVLGSLVRLSMSLSASCYWFWNVDEEVS